MEDYSVVSARHYVGDSSYLSFVLAEGYVEQSVSVGPYDASRQICGFLNAAWGLVRSDLTGETLEYTEAFLVQWLSNFHAYDVMEMLDWIPDHKETAMLKSGAKWVVNGEFSDVEYGDQGFV